MNDDAQTPEETPAIPEETPKETVEGVNTTETNVAGTAGDAGTADTAGTASTAGTAGATGDAETPPPPQDAFWQEQYARLTARAAILAEGGHVALLEPHVLAAMSLGRTDDGVTITCSDGETHHDPVSFVKSLRGRDGFENAFTAPAPGPVAAGGSGSRPSSVAPHGSVNAEDPLAIGHALEAIARGERTVSH